MKRIALEAPATEENCASTTRSASRSTRRRV